jgi:peptide/nickel transport system permease protein
VSVQPDAQAAIAAKEGEGGVAPLLPVAGADEAPLGERRRLGLGFWLAVGWVLLVVVVCALAPVLPIADHTQRRNGPPNSGFTSDNWLGTDNLGRDLLSRTIWGGRVSLLIGFVSIAFGIAVGGTFGLIAGFHRGRLDRVIMAIFDISLAFPAVVLALLLVTFLGQKLQWILLAIGILAIAPIGRLARANTMAYAQRDFVTAARALGAKGPRIMVREILPNIVVAMAALALLGTALAIVSEGSLAFLGLSVEGDTETWGKMIVAGSAGSALRNSPLMAFVPIGAMFSTLLALNLIGDRLRAHFDVRESLL